MCMVFELQVSMDAAAHLSSSSNSECVPELSSSNQLNTVGMPETTISDNQHTNVLAEEADGPVEAKSCASAFEEFISTCTKYLKLPEEERIIERLKKNFDGIGQDSFQNEELYSSLKRFTSELQQKSDHYIIIQEVIYNFKSMKAKLAEHKVRSAHIKKLEQHLGYLDKRIKKIQAKEVNLDDDNNSAYILEDRYIAKFNKVYNKLCDLQGCSRLELKTKIEYNGTRYPEINSNVTKYLRKHNDEFPDYPTILSLIEETNEAACLHLSEESISQMARDVFEAVGTQLKKRRLEDFTFTFGCYLTDSIQSDDSNDPAALDTELREKLEANSKIGKRRIDEVIESFVVKQEARVNGAAENGNKTEESSNSDSEEEETESEDNGSGSVDDDIQLIESSSSEREDSDAEVKSNSSSTKVVCFKTESVNSNSDRKERKCVEPSSNRFTVVRNTLHLGDKDTKNDVNECASSRPMKRQRSPVNPDVKENTVKKRVVVEQFIDDDVIVLSD